MNSPQNQEIKTWLQSLHLSKPIHNTSRDFSDAVLLAEIIAHFLPRYVSLNTFGHVHSFALKRYNWETLQKVVLRHLNIQLSASQINQLANSEEGAIESLIWLVRQRIEEALEKRRFRPTSGATSSQISRRSSREGSTTFLDKVGIRDSSAAPDKAKSSSSGNDVGTCNKSDGSRPFSVNSFTSNGTPEKSLNLEDLGKDQLIEKLYAKIRWQEAKLTKKEEQIEMLTKQINGLLQIARNIKDDCSPKKPPPTRAPTMIVRDLSDDSLCDDNLGTNGLN